MKTEYFSEISKTLQILLWHYISEIFMIKISLKTSKLHGIIVDINWLYFVRKEKQSSSFIFVILGFHPTMQE